MIISYSIKLDTLTKLKSILYIQAKSPQIINHNIQSLVVNKWNLFINY